MSVDDIEDFAALAPFFEIVREGLAGLVDGDHFFDLLGNEPLVGPSLPSMFFGIFPFERHGAELDQALEGSCERLHVLFQPGV